VPQMRQNLRRPSREPCVSLLFRLCCQAGRASSHIFWEKERVTMTGTPRKEPPPGCVMGELCPKCGEFPERTYPCEHCGGQCCPNCTVVEGQAVCSSKCLQALADKQPNPTSDIVAELRRIGDKIDTCNRIAVMVALRENMTEEEYVKTMQDINL